MHQSPLLDLVIVGTQKSFTTSLKSYLGEHPDVIVHPQVELAYFADDKEYAKGYKKALAHYYHNINATGGKKMVAKNAVLYASEIALKRLHDHNPKCKIVLSLRNPVDRAYSAYLMEYNLADVKFGFEEIKSIATNADTNYWPFNIFIDAGNYARHIKTIYKYFPKEQVKIVLCEELLEDPLKVCKELFNWLGIDEDFKPEIKVHNPTVKNGSKLYAKASVNLLKRSPFLRKSASLFVPSHFNHKIGNFIRGINKTDKKYPPMNPSTRKFLLDYYRNANKELEELTGKKVTTLWSK